MEQLKFLDIIKQKLQSFSVDNLFEILIYFGAGFVLGLILKYSIRYFLWFLIFAIATLWAVQNFGIAVINYDYFKEVLSLAQDYTISDLLNMGLEFVRDHIGESLSFIFGVYLSWELL